MRIVPGDSLSVPGFIVAAGIAMKDNFFWPGLILLVVAMFGLISAAAAVAYRHYKWHSTAVLIAVLGTVAGALWLVMEHRSVTRTEVVGRARANHNS